MRPSFILGALSLVLMALSVTDAAHCTTWTTSDPEVDTDPLGVLGSRQYIDNDLCQPDCLFSIWLYQEGNGIDGLQRGDEVVDDTCHGMIDPDVIWCNMLPMVILTGDRKQNKAMGAALGAAVLVGATTFLPTAAAC